MGSVWMGFSVGPQYREEPSYFVFFDAPHKLIL